MMKTIVAGTDGLLHNKKSSGSPEGLAGEVLSRLGS